MVTIMTKLKLKWLIVNRQRKGLRENKNKQKVDLLSKMNQEMIRKIV